jgi:ribonuclease BN (tRNA processing enzyme)
VLTHISSRHSEDSSISKQDARTIFEKALVAQDLMTIEIGLRDA